MFTRAAPAGSPARTPPRAPPCSTWAALSQRYCDQSKCRYLKGHGPKAPAEQQRTCAACIAPVCAPAPAADKPHQHCRTVVWCRQVYRSTYLGRATQAASPVARCAASASTPFRRIRSRWWASPSLRPAKDRPAADCRNCRRGTYRAVSVGSQPKTHLLVADTGSARDWRLYWGQYMRKRVLLAKYWNCAFWSVLHWPRPSRMCCSVGGTTLAGGDS